MKELQIVTIENLKGWIEIHQTMKEKHAFQMKLMKQNNKKSDFR